MYGTYILKIFIPKTGNIQHLVAKVAHYVVTTRKFGQNCVHSNTFRITQEYGEHLHNFFLCETVNL